MYSHDYKIAAVKRISDDSDQNMSLPKVCNSERRLEFKSCQIRLFGEHSILVCPNIHFEDTTIHLFRGAKLELFCDPLRLAAARGNMQCVQALLESRSVQDNFQTEADCTFVATTQDLEEGSAPRPGDSGRVKAWVDISEGCELGLHTRSFPEFSRPANPRHPNGPLPVHYPTSESSALRYDHTEIAELLAQYRERVISSPEWKELVATEAAKGIKVEFNC
ncbi:hypothetical protein DFH27DRAFT_553015 [Peziza echinospora]|nr:hypothetical protein DFH27DRAFT_553015 [Peziza echinospora]